LSETEEFRATELQGKDFVEMPTPEEQRRQHAQRQRELQIEAEANLARRTRLATPAPTEWRGVGRDRLFAALKEFTEQK
jgi:hypothetical protein